MKINVSKVKSRHSFKHFILYWQKFWLPAFLTADALLVVFSLVDTTTGRVLGSTTTERVLGSTTTVNLEACSLILACISSSCLAGQASTACKSS